MTEIINEAMSLPYRARDDRNNDHVPNVVELCSVKWK